MITLIAIENDEDLKNYWPEVKVGLEKVLEKNPSGWIPEDVFFSVKTKQSILIVGEDDHGYFSGFTVLNSKQGYDGLEFFLWAIYNNTDHSNGTDNKEILEAWNKVVDFCKKAGARRITMLSSRSGWKRTVKRFGFKESQVLYSLDF